MAKKKIKRKSSKIVVPEGGEKEAMVAFRCNKDLKDFLDQNVENKSDFIIKAIYKALGRTCPRCKGKGVI